MSGSVWYLKGTAYHSSLPSLRNFIVKLHEVYIIRVSLNPAISVRVPMSCPSKIPDYYKTILHSILLVHRNHLISNKYLCFHCCWFVQLVWKLIGTQTKPRKHEADIVWIWNLKSNIQNLINVNGVLFDKRSEFTKQRVCFHEIKSRCSKSVCTAATCAIQSIGDECICERYYCYSKFRNTRHRTKHCKKRCLKVSFEWIVSYKRQKFNDCLIAFKAKKIPFIVTVHLKLNTV